MLPDPKKIAVAILAKGKPHEGDDAGPADSLEAAAQDILDAVKADSAKELAEALRSAWELLDAPEESEESEEEK